MQIWQMRRPSSFCDPNVEFEAISKSQIRYKRKESSRVPIGPKKCGCRTRFFKTFGDFLRL